MRSYRMMKQINNLKKYQDHGDAIYTVVGLQVFRGKIKCSDLGNIWYNSTRELGLIFGREIMKDHDFHVLTHVAEEVFLAA